MSKEGFTKRLQQLGRVFGYHKPRTIVFAVNGNEEIDEAAIDELLAPLDPQPDDTRIAIARFVEVADLPKIISVD
jgi:hypothetical protein